MTDRVSTPTRSRTRRAILDAALGVLCKNPGASLGKVADAAHVARSTLHRYFPERSVLIDSLGAYTAAQMSAASERARLEDGPASEALIRLCHEYFDIWDAITWAYMESVKEASRDCVDDQLDPGLTGLIERGYADGTIDRSQPNAWIQQMLWTLLYSSWEYIQQGASKHEALTLCLSTLRKLIAPTSPGTG